ncbi:hypothetical protein GCM10007888_15240 [Methylobacterium oxalidis]|uniref:HTH cro/C1-type domain-containing protein n=1 Tax=Methylobacterium oxalidis TaxID=944322 RepID=A0ABQ6DEA1_9HYPH|nr:hypothetical protein GCM10007888_15240 [Methylobacterium oxalidis]
MDGEVARPVDVARLLTDQGLSLRRAHALLDRLAEGRAVVVGVPGATREDLVVRLAELGVRARALRTPEVSSREVRAKLDLSQAEFALRFGFELDTVQNWDQGRNRPDTATRILLAVIARDPDLVDAVLAGEEPTAR